MFLIGAFIIAASIIMLKVTIKAPSIEEDLKLIEITMENDIVSNFRTELENSAKFSIDTKENISLNVFDFSNFTERKAAEHSLDFELLFAGSLANTTSSKLNVSVINMLDEPINAGLDLNDGSEAQTHEMGDSTKWDAQFDFTPGTEYNLTISHNSSTYAQNVTIKTKNNRDVYVSFFDTRLESLDAVYTNKTQDTYNLK